MPTKAEIVNQIEDQIIPNLMELITGGILQNVLLGMVDQINTLVGELDDLNTDDRSSIVNAINELVSNIQAIEDNLTPYVYFGLDDPNIVTPVGFGGDIPSFYVQQQHSGLDVVNIGFWTYTGILGKEWVDLSLSSGGGTPSLSEVLVEGNVADRDIEFDSNIYNGGIYQTYNTYKSGIFFNQDETLDIYSQRGSTRETRVFLNDIGLNVEGNESFFKGLQGIYYYGANYDDNTYVQKKYVDDNFVSLPTEGTSETIRMVLTPDGEDAETGDKMSFFADGDYEIISVNATAQTAPTGSAITIGLKVNGVDVTDVPITIPNGSKTSFASTPAEFTATIELGDEITPNITAVGSTIKGKDVQLIFKYKEII